MTSQWLASSLGSKSAGGGRSPHAPTASSALASGVKSWPPAGGGGDGAAAPWVSGLMSGDLTSATWVPVGCFPPTGATADGVVCEALDAEPALPLAGSLPWHATARTPEAAIDAA